MADLNSFATTFLACLSALAVKELYTKLTSESITHRDQATATTSTEQINDEEGTASATNNSGVTTESPDFDKKQKLIDSYLQTLQDDPVIEEKSDSSGTLVHAPDSTGDLEQTEPNKKRKKNKKKSKK